MHQGTTPFAMMVLISLPRVSILVQWKPPPLRVHLRLLFQLQHLRLCPLLQRLLLHSYTISCCAPYSSACYSSYTISCCAPYSSACYARACYFSARYSSARYFKPYPVVRLLALPHRLSWTYKGKGQFLFGMSKSATSSTSVRESINPSTHLVATTKPIAGISLK